MSEVKIRPTTPEMVREGPVTRSLNRYIVEVDGERVGIVGQHRVSTVTAYTGRNYGFEHTRTAWCWEADEPLGGGDYEFPTRKAAIDDLVGYVTSLSKDV